MNSGRLSAALAGTALLAALTACGSDDSSPAAAADSQVAGDTARQERGAGQDDRNGVSGEIADKDGRTYQVQGRSGQVAVTVDDTTALQKQQTGTIADITVGQCITVMTGTDTQTVRVTPATDGSCTDGGPGGTGGPGGAGAPTDRPEGAPTDRPGGAPSDMPEGGPDASGQRVSGLVSAVSGTSLTVEAATRDTETTTSTEVELISTVVVTTTVAGTLRDLAVGSCLTAFGNTDSTGAVSATQATVSAKVEGECTAGFVGFGGRGGPGGQPSGAPSGAADGSAS